jgi:acyl-CoA thioester hydrolase
MYEFTYRHRVRYRECDPMGVVYHAHYVDYFEAARTEALREMGMPYRELEEAGIIMPVVDLRIKYHSPSRYDDLLEIATTFDDVPEFRLPIRYAVQRHGESRLLSSGHVTLCFVDRARNRPIRCPDPLRKVFENARLTHAK